MKVAASRSYRGITVREYGIPYEDCIYPATLDELVERLRRFDARDLEGLREVSLAPDRCKRPQANGRYFRDPAPTVYLHPMPATLTYKVPRGRPHMVAANAFPEEVTYGMTAERQGSGWVCTWRREDWSRFILEHVLAHEVGHHVHHEGRYHGSRPTAYGTPESEKIAEHYARRFRRTRAE